MQNSWLTLVGTTIIRLRYKNFFNEGSKEWRNITESIDNMARLGSVLLCSYNKEKERVIKINCYAIYFYATELKTWNELKQYLKKKIDR